MATEASDASGTLLFDVAQRRWSESMLKALDIPAALLPTVHGSTSVIGGVSAAAASRTGLVEGTPVVAGGADNACAAVGAGVVAPGTVLVSIGTSGTVISPTEAAVVDPQARLHCFCHAVPDTWYLMGVVLSAGGSLRWYRDVIATEERRRALESGRDAYELIAEVAELAPPGSEGLLFLPYLTGERTPHGDPDARGVFFGLSLRHGREHLARSVFEGVTFALADSAALMRELRVEVGTVRATGGGARSAFWRQLLADVLRARVTRTNADEGPALGAAILAGTGIGVFSSVTDATDKLVSLGQETTPRPEMAKTYDAYRSLYDALYPALREHFARDARMHA
jgi:xylulokinase